MDNGGGFGGNLADGMAALAVNDSTSANLEDNSYHTHNSDSLYRVMRAVEAAEATIRQQVEENDRLRVELQRKSQELDKIKSDEIVGERPLTDDKWDHHACGPNSSHQSVSPVESHSEINNKMIGILKVHPGSQPPADNTGFSQFSPQSVASFSPTRYPMEGEYDPHFSMPGHGVMTMADISTSSSLWKQIREHEQEIMQLRKHLAEYSVKEAQIRNEKYVLEKRIAYMRMAFDQQQQDLVDATSKALSYRQDIIEENISLTYALQDAQQERTTFVSSLLPLLAEYSLQPQVPDAQSIVSNLKVLFKHLQEKLVVTEAKLKESQYQLAPWHSEVNKSNFAPSSPSYSIGAALATSSKNGLELVPQPTYSVEKIPFSSSEMLSTIDWDAMGHRQNTLDGAMAAKNLETDDSGGYTFLASRASAVHDRPTQIASTHNDSHETPNKQVTFSDPVTATDMDDADRERQQNERERSTNWDSGNPSYTSTHDDPSSSYIPYLPAVLEEPSSSFSEAADDALPAIESLQISGEAFPGRELQACGYSINGTTSCNFEWVRHLENGSVNYIEGAKQPNYLVTADDVDAYLAIEVQPLDNRKRKGELVKVFANEHRKIVCDDDMHHQIEKTLYSGHASYKVSLWTGYLNIWEPASLAVKREGYSIKCTAPSGFGVAEKFSPTIRVIIPYGNPSEFSIIGAGVEHLLRAENIDISCSRDTIVLTMRLFIIRASEKKKGRKKGLFFNKSERRKKREEERFIL